MSAITTHVLDTARGVPAAGVSVRLEGPDGVVLATASTDDDGRVGQCGPDTVSPGTYRLVFDTAAYFAATDQPCFFPEVTLSFTVTGATRHHHVPLLLSPYAYSSYRGS